MMVAFLVYLLRPVRAMRDAMALSSVTFSFSNCSYFAGGNDLKACGANALASTSFFRA